MPEFHQALSVPVEEDLQPLCALLRQQGVSHRIYEASGRQVIEVRRVEHVDQVRLLYGAWREGKVRIDVMPGTAPAAPTGNAHQWRAVPVTLALVALSVAGFLLVYIPGPMAWLGALTFTPMLANGVVSGVAGMGGEYWRLVTPAFLHFGWLHIVFNSLWLWELGARVEKVMGHMNMLLIFLAIAAASNVSQYLFGGGGLFGGMSGVVYGLLGFSWVAPLLQPAWRIQPPKSVMLLMIGWLFACLVGLVEALGFGAIANAAHFSGLFCGALLGALFAAISRSGDNRGASRL